MSEKRRNVVFEGPEEEAYGPDLPVFRRGAPTLLPEPIAKEIVAKNSRFRFAIKADLWKSRPDSGGDANEEAEQ